MEGSEGDGLPSDCLIVPVPLFPHRLAAVAFASSAQRFASAVRANPIERSDTQQCHTPHSHTGSFVVARLVVVAAMKVEVPEICYHALDKVMPIYAVDAHTATQTISAKKQQQTDSSAATPLITRMVTCGTDRAVRVWQISSTDGPSGGSEPPTASALSSNASASLSAVYASAAAKRTQVTFLADLATGGDSKGINVVKFSPNGRFVATAGDGQ